MLLFQGCSWYCTAIFNRVKSNSHLILQNDSLVINKIKDYKPNSCWCENLPENFSSKISFTLYSDNYIDPNNVLSPEDQEGLDTNGELAITRLLY